MTVYTAGSGVLPAGVWYRAKRTVSLIFGQIGVPLKWMSGKAPADPQHLSIVIRFADELPGSSGCASSQALACAWPFREDTPEVVVMWNRVLPASRRTGLLEPLLAHVLAHEIVHVLELTDVHSETGIMKKHWTAEDLERMQKQSLEFTALDVEFIQDGLDYRMRRRPAQ